MKVRLTAAHDAKQPTSSVYLPIIDHGEPTSVFALHQRNQTLSAATPLHKLWLVARIRNDWELSRTVAEAVETTKPLFSQADLHVKALMRPLLGRNESGASVIGSGYGSLYDDGIDPDNAILHTIFWKPDLVLKALVQVLHVRTLVA